MKKFLKFIEEARRTTPTIKKDSGDYVSLNSMAAEKFWKDVEECQPFVFADDNVEWEYDNEAEKDVKLENAPFRVFSIEMLNMPLVGAHKEGNKDNKAEHLFVDCVMCVEDAPMKWVFHCLIRSDDFSHQKVMSNVISVGPIINKLLAKINAGTVGVETKRERVKIGTGPSKKTHTIRRIVHVVPKKERETYIATNKIVSWSHRWWVRGHWRKSEGLGKDRDGNYSVSGFTWVTEHVKGPEDSPIIKKTRVALEGG